MTEGISFTQLALLFKISRHIPPIDPGAPKVPGWNIRFTELDIAIALRRYAPELQTLTSSLRPDQEMVRWVKKEFSISRSKIRPASHTSYQSYPKSTGYPPTATASARTKWHSYAKQARRTADSHGLSIRSFALYRLRFSCASDLCKCWERIGGLSPMLSHLYEVLHIGITEASWVDLSYRRIVGAKLLEKARKRRSQASEFAEMLASEHLTF